MSRIRHVFLMAVVLLGFGCAVWNHQAYTVKEPGPTPDADYWYRFRVYSTGPINQFWREPLLIPLIAYADFQGPPFAVDLEVSDANEEYELIRIRNVTLICGDGQQIQVEAEQSVGIFRTEDNWRKTSFPVIDGLLRHEPMELHVDAILERKNGTTREVRISCQLIPETDRGMKDAVSFTIFDIT
jgi:hypothetical protein